MPSQPVGAGLVRLESDQQIRRNSGVLRTSANEIIGAGHSRENDYFSVGGQVDHPVRRLPANPEDHQRFYRTPQYQRDYGPEKFKSDRSRDEAYVRGAFDEKL